MLAGASFLIATAASATPQVVGDEACERYEVDMAYGREVVARDATDIPILPAQDRSHYAFYFAPDAGPSEIPAGGDHARFRRRIGYTGATGILARLCVGAVGARSRPLQWRYRCAAMAAAVRLRTFNTRKTASR